jgi:hypothetical protein
MPAAVHPAPSASARGFPVMAQKRHDILIPSPFRAVVSA